MRTGAPFVPRCEKAVAGVTGGDGGAAARGLALGDGWPGGAAERSLQRRSPLLALHIQASRARGGEKECGRENK